MEHSDDFYVVLPSNSSMTYFPDNTTTNFCTRLPREIKLSEGWLVGLVEIHIPCTVNHIQKSDTAYQYSSSDHDVNAPVYDETFHIQPGWYDSLTQLADAINDANKQEGHQILQPSTEQRGYWELRHTCKRSDYHLTTFNEKIKKFLAFPVARIECCIRPAIVVGA